jgi:hypothetical protein
MNADKNADDPTNVPEASPLQTAQHAASAARGLALFCRQVGFETLAFLFEMAEQEARSLEAKLAQSTRMER